MGAEAQADSGDPVVGEPRPVTVGVPRETADGERRVALVPQVVGRLRSRGLTVVVEPGAGLGALIPDEQFTADCTPQAVPDPSFEDTVTEEYQSVITG